MMPSGRHEAPGPPKTKHGPMAGMLAIVDAANVGRWTGELEFESLGRNRHSSVSFHCWKV